MHALKKLYEKYSPEAQSAAIQIQFDAYAQRGCPLDATARPTLNAWSDADWGQCPTTGRSTTGYLITLGSGAVEWSSRLQSSVAMSSCESECFAIAATVIEIEYLRGLLAGIANATAIRFDNDSATAIHVDNQSAIYDAYNRTGRRTRAINIRFHRVREAISQRVTKLIKVRGGNSVDSKQLADMFTKAVNRKLFLSLRSRFMN